MFENCVQTFRSKHSLYYSNYPSLSINTPSIHVFAFFIEPSSIISLIVDVDDVNDNPPYFPSDQAKVFGVPDNARENYLVGTIKVILYQYRQYLQRELINTSIQLNI